MATEEPTELESKIAFRRITIWNRTDAAVAISMHLEGVESPSRAIEPGTTFVWGVRHNRPLQIDVASETIGTSRLSLELQDRSIAHHVIIDLQGVRHLDSRSRKGPDQHGGIRRVQVGCGPHNLFPDWWNVDIRDFPGVDATMDVTKEWPYSDLDYVYGEHFLEHLPVEGALDFLVAAGKSLRTGGTLRLTTPSLEWVVRSHFPLDAKGDKIEGSFAINRAFHGWGHKFLYSREFLNHILENLGYSGVRFFDYNISEDPNLAFLERHGGFRFYEGVPSLLVVEARNGGQVAHNPSLRTLVKKKFTKYVAGGH